MATEDNQAEEIQGERSGEESQSFDEANVATDANLATDGNTETDSNEKPSSDDNGTQTPLVGRARFSVITIAVFAFAVIVAINWPLEYVAILGSGQTKATIDFDVLSYRVMPRMAGWPLHYWITYPEAQGSAGTSYFSLIALMINITLAAVPAALLALYAYRRERRGLGNKRTNISIADLLVITLLLAAPFGWFQFQKSRAKKTNEVASQLRSSGNAVRTAAWIPAVLEDRLPDAIAKQLIGIREVRMENPSDEQIKTAVGIPTLTVCRLGGGDYDLRLLDELGKRIHLTDLRIAGRELDGQVIAMINAHRRLNTLNLMRTNVSAEALQSLDQVASLQRLNLIHSDVRLADLDRPPWSKTVKTLVCPHPDPGEESSLRIEDWPELSELSINELDTQLNSKAMTVRLANLPKLKTLKLDQFQKYALELEHLPELTTIEGLSENWRVRVPRGGTIPGVPWYEKFRGIDLPKLGGLDFYAVNTKEFLLRGAPSIRDLGIGVFYFSNESNTSYAPKLEPEIATALIEGLGRSEGPSTIDLDAVPLANVDLSPLANNKQITALYIGTSNSTIKEWKKLEPMKWLEKLRLSGNAISQSDIAWALKTFPKLTVLECESTPGQQVVYRSMGEILELVGHPKLKTLVIDADQMGYGHLERLRIVDMPQLEMPLSLQWVGRLEIQNAGRLTGLSINCPLHGQMKINALPNAEFFALGGDGVTDQWVSKIDDAKNLNTLTLAYCNVSEEKLGKLPLEKIEKLYLPGCAVTDKVVAQWPELSTLSQLDLRDTKITGKSLQKLTGSGMLRTLKLDGCKLGSDDVGTLGSFEMLTNLSLAGIQIDASLMSAILQHGNLKQLNLSSTQLSNELLDAIAKSKTGMEFLVLRDCEFENQSFAKMAQAQPDLIIDPTGSTLDTRLYSQLLGEGRVKEEMEFQQEKRMRAMMANMRPGMGVPMTLYGETYDSIIDVNAFADEGRFGKRATRARRQNSFGGMLMQVFGGPSAAPGGPSAAPGETRSETHADDSSSDSEPEDQNAEISTKESEQDTAEDDSVEEDSGDDKPMESESGGEQDENPFNVPLDQDWKINSPENGDLEDNDE